MAEPAIRRRNKDSDQKSEPSKREDTPVERWRPFQEYDKFREPGKSWRGDDPEIRRNPRPSSRPEQRSSVEPTDIPLEAAKQRLAMEGRNGDTEIAHVNPEEKMLLAMRGGAGTVNPDTGMAEFYPVEQQDEEKANVLAEGDLSSAAPDKAAVEELKAIRDMIREAKTSGKVEDKKTLREITKRHKQLLENLIANAANPKTKEITNAKEGAPGGVLRTGTPTDAQDLRNAILAKLDSGSTRPNPATGTEQRESGLVTAPAVWQSAPDHPPTMLAYITPEEAELLSKMDLHASGVSKERHFGPEGLPSFNGIDGGLGDGTTSSGVDTGAGGSAVGAGGSYADVNANPGGAVGFGVDTSQGLDGTDLDGANFGYGNPSYADPGIPGPTIGFQGEAEISDQRNAPVPSYSAGLIGAFQDPLGWGKAHTQGFVNNLVNDPFGTIAGALAGAVVGAATKGIATGLAGPVAGQVAGMVASNLAGNAVQSAVTGAVANAGQQSTTSPNQSAPGTTTSVTTDPGFADDTRGGSGSGTAPLNYDARIAPLTSAAVTPLAVQPTTTIADSTPATQNPFLSGIYIPPIGAPTAGRPLAIT